MLRIDKPENDDSSAKRILQQSLALTRPFGVHTLVLQPESLIAETFEQQQSIPVSVEHKVYDFLRARFAAHSDVWADYESHHHDGAKTMASIVMSGAYMARHSWVLGRSGNMRIYHEHLAPVANIVLASRMPVSQEKGVIPSNPLWEDAAAASDLPEDLPDGSCIQELRYQLCHLCLWHEYAHGAGANEPQADMISAIRHRQSFRDDKRVLTMMADYRAVSAVLNATDQTQAGLYGWPMVDALEQVIEMPQEQIDEWRAAEYLPLIIGRRFPSHHDALSDVFRATNVAMAASDNTLDALHSLQDRLAHLAEEMFKVVSSPRQLAGYNGQVEMAHRFILAAGRLSQGLGAYRMLPLAHVGSAVPVKRSL